MQVREMMTPDPVTVDAGAELDRAIELMDEHRIRHLPVVEADRIVGVVSDRDLLEATGWLPARVRDVYKGPEARAHHVRDVMHAPARTVAPYEQVVSMLVEHTTQRIGCLPIVEDGRLVGIVTEMDVLDAFLRACADASGDESVDPEVRRLMAHDPVALEPHATVAEARRKMAELAVHHLPVCQQKRLVGIVSDRDLRRAQGSGFVDEHAIDDVMAREVASVRRETRVSRAVELMHAGRFSALPVVEDDLLVGILTLTDVLDHCLGHLRERR